MKCSTKGQCACTALPSFAKIGQGRLSQKSKSLGMNQTQAADNFCALRRKSSGVWITPILKQAYCQENVLGEEW